jgi:hypothetical protein
MDNFVLISKPVFINLWLADLPASADILPAAICLPGSFFLAFPAS